MAGNTGIKNRSEYIQRILQEDKRLGEKDEVYGEYLESLSMLMLKTNEIYNNNDGKLDKTSYADLVKLYLDVAQKGDEYRNNGTSKTRINVVEHILKIISKDLKALNSLDKDNPGMLDDAFEKSRTAKVVVSESLVNRVGGQMSDRFPIKSEDGKKGFFTARTDTAKDQKWEELFARIEALSLPKEQMEKLNAIKTDHRLRSSLKDISSKYNKKKDNLLGMAGMRAHFAFLMGFGESKDKADDMLQADDNLNNAFKLLTTEGLNLMMPYDLSKRLGYDPYTRNDNKNSAMYEVAKLLGCERIIAKATPMVVVAGNRVLKGTYMEQAEGSDIENLKSDDPLRSYNINESPYNKNLYLDLADMQVLDYICGNIDRHKGNMFYKSGMDKNGNVKMTGIVGIDNDASFPEKDIADHEFHHYIKPRYRRLARIYKPANFRYVTKKTADIVSNLTRAQLETTLRGHNLSKTAIDKAWERTQEVQRVLSKPKEYNISYADDLTEDVSRDKYTIANPFCNISKFQNHPSIFNMFDDEMQYAFKHAGKKHTSEMKLPEYKKAGREMAMVIAYEKISAMNSLMKRVNRLKSPSEEFSKMSTAMYELNECSKALSDKVIRAESLDDTDYKNYEDCLNKLNETTKAYIQKKGITPKTEKGRERLGAAMSFENRVEDLFRDFEAEKKSEEVKADPNEMENDNEL